ncbi:hypothetical protein TCAL_16721 [Tigriopus californicus]|uniref:Uncharacterized protein n=2 Tax=Tigriopus californicus TaxID=6832 RepID=A0A553PK78_TIGCA|nr:hypothetical protein TCAL_16721 [Tigriopus californicus]
MFTIGGDGGDGGGGGGGGGGAQSERLSFGGSFQESDNQERPGRGDLSGEIMAPGVEHTTRGELENAHGSHNGMAFKTRRGLRRGLSVLSKSWRRNISKDDMKR